MRLQRLAHCLTSAIPHRVSVRFKPFERRQRHQGVSGCEHAHLHGGADSGHRRLRLNGGQNPHTGMDQNDWPGAASGSSAVCAY